MSQNVLKLDRPLVFFDLETTGTNVIRDRIVEICIIKLNPDGSKERKTRRLNPEMQIPEEASRIHHITDEDVRNEPTFRQVARSLYEFLDNCDIAGFNSNKFDVPVLIEEFARAGINFNVSDRRFVDVQNIFHKMEQRTLVAAYKFYCGKDLTAAHSADADTEATMEVLMAQVEKYDELGNDIKSLSEFSSGGKNVDLAARIVLNDDDIPVFNFGKHKGKPVEEVFYREPSFYSWIMQGEFPKNTKDVLTQLYYAYQQKRKK
ncbi:MAG: 3'-5' exonuclease [Muribaculaceae bacterium]|nr:3'-5' exonuclease [Muribaculaceae bacterium]